MTEIDKDILATFLFYVKKNLDADTLKLFAKLSNYNTGLFNTKRKQHLKNEVAFVSIFICDSIAKSNKISDLQTVLNLIFKTEFQDVNEIEWYKTLNIRLNQYYNVANSEQYGGLSAVIGSFLVYLFSIDNKIPSFFSQTGLTEFIGKYSEELLNSICKLQNGKK